MRIGIYVGSVVPQAGGAYTLIETLKNDISLSDSKYDFFFFFEDISSPNRFINNKITYINVFNKSKNKITFCYRVRRKVLKILGLYREHSSLDDILQEEGIDLLWILGPYNIDVTIPYVFTVWDLGHRMLPCFPEVSAGSSWSAREKLYQKMLYRATYVITGNETGKREILANYSINEDKIRIIPFPVPDFCFSDTEKSYREGECEEGIKTPFIFYPAQFWAHKNHIAIIEAIAWIRDVESIVIYCYFVGSDQGNEKYIKAIIAKYKLENQIFILGFIDRKTLIYLYQNALAMTFMSLMGPNNLPPLEAVALGCPLIISNIPGHIEQMEGSGLSVDATNPVAIGEAILSLHHNPDLRRSVIAKEVTFIKKYKNYSYFKQMQKIMDSYSLYCKTWQDT
jgi:glycosyltransferase involved in cell wall biosynthesis